MFQACLSIGAAAPVLADPMPKDFIGIWTDETGCGKGVHKMIFTTAGITIIQDDGRKKSVLIDASGNPDERLEVRVSKVTAGEEQDPVGAHVGDVLVLRRVKGAVQLIGYGDATVVHDTPDGPVMHRCPS
jgi:hypothetical protein